FVGNDEVRAFQGERYTSVAEGTLGESMRAFMPIWYENEQVGVVAEGILLDKVEDAVFSSRYIMYIGTAVAIDVGRSGAVLLVRSVIQTFYCLKIREIAQLL